MKLNDMVYGSTVGVGAVLFMAVGLGVGTVLFMAVRVRTVLFMAVRTVYGNLTYSDTAALNQ